MPKFIFPVLLLLLLATNAVAQTDQTGWVEFAPEGGGFSVLLPSTPVEAVKKNPKYTMHSFTTTAGRATYVATYTDYEPIKQDPATFLALNRDRFNKGLQATPVSSREITLDGHTGLEFTSETPAANIKSQMFMIGNRLFQTATLVFKDMEDQARYVDRFFESFKFKK